MKVDTSKMADDFGETTLTSKGQITLPSGMRQSLDLAAGDRLHFFRDEDGTIIMSPRKRRSIVDIARENAFKIGDLGRDLDALINEAVSEAMSEQELRARSRGGS